MGWIGDGEGGIGWIGESVDKPRESEMEKGWGDEGGRVREWGNRESRSRNKLWNGFWFVCLLCEYFIFPLFLFYLLCDFLMFIAIIILLMHLFSKRTWHRTRGIETDTVAN